MFKRILIANRGEIAARVIRCCNKLGIQSVVLYAASDRLLPYLQDATIAIEIPYSQGINPYINQTLIIAHALANKVEAIHPGYGFLSENSEFAKLCAENKLIFIGPSASTIEKLGDKNKARELAKSLNIPILGGSSLNTEDLEQGLSQCEAIGFPVMIKATGAGGGRAMRKVSSKEEFSTALKQVLNEAKLFGKSEHIIVEKYLLDARHIEVQLCGFQNGEVIHLGQRDCSAQRRYQKLIEEAPAPNLNSDLSDKISETATLLGAKANLSNLATAEFLCTKDAFYFLEVNPRLQVEHTVTEEVTGVDLVELQLKVASDQNFSLAQESISISGCAVQVRIVAESPEQNYMPSSRNIEFLDLTNTARIEHALTLKNKPNLNFDSLLAKVICHAPSTLEARDKCIEALSKIAIVGPATTINFLQAALKNRKPYTITYLGDHYSDLVENKIPDLATLAGQALFATNSLTPSENKSSFSLNHQYGHIRPRALSYCIESDSIDSQVYITVKEQTSKKSKTGITLNSDQLESTWEYIKKTGEATELKVEFNSDTHKVLVVHNTSDTRNAWVLISGHSFLVQTHLPVRGSKIATQSDYRVLSPLPGTITAIHTKEGEHINSGKVLFSLESMKMEHSILATHSGVLESIEVSLNQSVTRSQVLAMIMPRG